MLYRVTKQDLVNIGNMMRGITVGRLGFGVDFQAVYSYHVVALRQGCYYVTYII